MIVGLGNPGAQYRGTRHNIGFELVEHLAAHYGIKITKSKHKSQFGVGMIDDTCVVLVKPLTFMNLSGQAVAPLAKEYSIPPEKILVATDDLDLPVGKLRFRAQGSSGGHNGHKSLIHSLGTQEYPRLRFGIGKSEDPTIEHVLGRFTPDEWTDMKKCLERSTRGIEILFREGFDSASQFLNR
jgi:PTH1 family peptidyl-tRNA hydrolase